MNEFLEEVPVAKQYKNVYLSSAYSACPEYAKALFKAAKEWVLDCFSHEHISVWVPTEQIPETSTWEQSMDICRKAFVQDTINCMYVFLNDYTYRSSGVMQELSWADEFGVPVVFVHAFGNEKAGFHFIKQKSL